MSIDRSSEPDLSSGRALRGSGRLMPAISFMLFVIIAISTYRKVRPDLAARAAAKKAEQQAQQK